MAGLGCFVVSVGAVSRSGSGRYSFPRARPWQNRYTRHLFLSLRMCLRACRRPWLDPQLCWGIEVDSYVCPQSLELLVVQGSGQDLVCQPILPCLDPLEALS